MERLPLHFDPVSNGEYEPKPMSAAERSMKRIARELVDEGARRTGVPRREFLTRLGGTAACLLAINEVTAARGGSFALGAGTLFDDDEASATLRGDEFIFDIQGHHVMPDGGWEKHNELIAGTLRSLNMMRGGAADFGRYAFVKEIFLDSDTDCCVLSAVPSTPEGSPLPPAEAENTRALVQGLGGSPRLWVHALATPNLGELQPHLDGMDRTLAEFPIAAWKVYTLYHPDGGGYWLDSEDIGMPFLEKVSEIGPKIVCMHKGIPLSGTTVHHTCRDVGVVAKRFEDIRFICYHAGYNPGFAEGPYDPDNASDGINALVKTLQDNEIAPNANVYAELGSTWWMLMRNPEAAAHALGKLLKHVGEDNVLWGTDSVWYGSPQPQIAAFRAFEISEELQELHGYPALTPELKAKVLGLNSARVYGIDPKAARPKLREDQLEKLRNAYLEEPSPSHRVYGPRTRREFLDLLRSRDGMPA